MAEPPRTPVLALDEIDRTTDIKGGEGLDANHMSRARIHYLLGQNDTLVMQLQFADAKAAALMTLMGLLALRGPVDFSLVTLSDPLSMASALLNMLCLAGCVVAIIPRYPAAPRRRDMRVRDRFSWPALAADDYDGTDYAEYMRTAEISQLVVSLAQSNAISARILLRKFKALRIAFLLGILNFAATLAGMALR